MDEALIKRYALPVPRYTSYPTANHFSRQVEVAEYRRWLGTLAPAAKLSLYVHIPFCRELCWYCGCSTKATRRTRPVTDYLDSLAAEITALAAALPGRPSVSHLHWGGGSPNILQAPDIVRLGAALRARFDIADRAEFAVEIDPRLLGRDQVDSFAAIGVNRISLGVQDFDPAVQRAIGRMQGFEETRLSVELFRERGIGSINIDLVYGLPYQTEASVVRTLEQVLLLSPDRIAIFGYAHLPSRIKHQRLIDEKALPGPLQRFAQSQRLAETLVAAGYRQIGIDHFARADDRLAQEPLARNFQGYTTDAADALLGLGASAISRLPQGYAQNAVSSEDYARRIARDGLATARGWALSEDDRVRAEAIERLMCDFTFSAHALKQHFGRAADTVVAEAAAVVAGDVDGLVEATADGFRVTPRGRPFVRNICAKFDAYLPPQVEQRRHALAV